MIFLSAQPDDTYFIWQLRVVLQNFKDHLISRDNVHVLISYRESIGLNPLFEDFIRENTDRALFFLYSDTRKVKAYAPSIRPHIIHKHFNSNKYLEHEAIFYHDADIVFTYALPDFHKLLKNDVIYVSDTRSYLDSKYLIRRCGMLMLRKMVSVVGVNLRDVVLHDKNAGGAQYLLKNISADFWEKIERDCTNIFLQVKNDEDNDKTVWERSTGINISDSFPVWCSDMWAILWNLILLKYQVEISSELSFCWPHEPKNFWENHKIFHNAGTFVVNSKKHFHKGFFREVYPDEVDLDFIEPNSCSRLYANCLRRSFKSSFDLFQASFIIFCDSRNKSNLHNELHVNLLFLEKHYVNFNVFLVMGPEVIKEVDYVKTCFKQRTDIKLFVVSSSDEIKDIMENYNFSNSSVIIKYCYNLVVPPTELYKSVIYVKSKTVDVALCHSTGQVFKVDDQLKSLFMKSLEVRTLARLLLTEQEQYPDQKVIYAEVATLRTCEMIDLHFFSEELLYFDDSLLISLWEKKLRINSSHGPAYLLI